MGPQTDLPSLALERVLARFADRVRQVGARYRLRGDDLDELFQQVRIRLWQAQRHPDTIETSPASYIYRTAVTAALDLLRRQQVKREVPLDGTPGAASVAETIEMHSAIQTQTIEQAIDSAELASRVARALDRVMDSRRPVVRMYLAGYKPDEIADVLGWTTVKTRNLLYRGLTDLRHELATEGITSAEDGWTV